MAYTDALQKKMMAFKASTLTRKTVFLTMITTYGVIDNAYKQQLVDSELTMNDLFE